RQQHLVEVLGGALLAGDGDADRAAVGQRRGGGAAAGVLVDRADRLGERRVDDLRRDGGQAAAGDVPRGAGGGGGGVVDRDGAYRLVAVRLLAHRVRQQEPGVGEGDLREAVGEQHVPLVGASGDAGHGEDLADAGGDPASGAYPLAPVRHVGGGEVGPGGDGVQPGGGHPAGL